MNRLRTHTFPDPGNHVGIISHAGGYKEECHLLNFNIPLRRFNVQSGPVPSVPMFKLTGFNQESATKSQLIFFSD